VANVRVSELTAAASALVTDQLEVNQGGVSKRVTAQQLVDLAGKTTPLSVGNGGTGTSTVFTLGSVLFAGSSGVYTQANSQLFWDNTNSRLGIGTTAPAEKLQVVGGGRFGAGPTDATNATIATYSDGTGISIEAFQGNASGTKRNLWINAYGGNVGIGTNSVASYKLTVGGSIGATGDITTYRSASPTTGAYYFGNTGGKYLFFDGSNYVFNGGGVLALQNGYRIQSGNGEYGEKQIALQNSNRNAYFYLGADGNVIGLWDNTAGNNRFYTTSDRQFYFGSNAIMPVFTYNGTYYTYALLGEPGGGQSSLRFYHTPGVEAGVQMFSHGYGFTFRNDGTAFAGNWYSTSDTRTKSDQVVIKNSLEKILKLQGITYRRNDVTKLDGSSVVDAGLIAQDVEKVLPECVERLTKPPESDPDGEGTLSLNYNGVTALLVNAVKELNAKTDAALAAKDVEIAALKGRLDALEQRLEALRGT
jgi:hypothetical protein